jgi:hypothetical protein
MLKLIRLNKKKYNLKRCIKCMYVYDCLYKVMMRMNMRVLKCKRSVHTYLMVHENIFIVMNNINLHDVEVKKKK